MSLGLQLRSGNKSGSSVRATVATLALFGLLWARSSPPDFPWALSSHPTANAAVHHEQRPRFHRDAPQWNPPNEARWLAPYPTESAHGLAGLRLVSSLQLEGFHYNRPPPIHR